MKKIIKTGDLVKLINYHKDNRPAIVDHIKGESVVLKESRGGYFIWNIFDVEKIKK